MNGKKIDEMMGNVVMGDELKNKIREKTVDKAVKYRRVGMKRIVLVATLCVAILGTMTVVAANNAEKIEKYFMNILGYDADTQKELEEDGFYQEMGVAYNEGDIIAVTDDGITVAVKETIVDKNVIKALIQIRTEDGIELGDGCYFKDWTIKGFVDEVPEVGKSPYIYTSTMEYAMEGTENLEGQWCIVNINNTNEEGLESGDIVEIIFDNIIKTDRITERLCEVKDGATFIYDDQEYILKKVGREEDMGEETIYDQDHWSNMYYSIDVDSKGDAYALVDAYGNPLESPCQIMGIDFCEDGDFLIEVLDDDNKDIVSDGEWTLKWELNVGEKCIQIPINETIEADNIAYPIDSVQITPCSFKISFSEDTDNPYLCVPLEAKVYMKDGSVYELGETDENSEVVAMSMGMKGHWYGFKSVMNLDNIDKISIEGKEYPVSE